MRSKPAHPAGWQGVNQLTGGACYCGCRVPVESRLSTSPELPRLSTRLVSIWLLSGLGLWRAPHQSLKLTATRSSSLHLPTVSHPIHSDYYTSIMAVLLWSITLLPTTFSSRCGSTPRLFPHVARRLARCQAAGVLQERHPCHHRLRIPGTRTGTQRTRQRHQGYHRSPQGRSLVEGGHRGRMGTRSSTQHWPTQP